MMMAFVTGKISGDVNEFYTTASAGPIPKN